jgi:antitoxin component YwqK of YwqJK toxin-antitoxin module
MQEPVEESEDIEHYEYNKKPVLHGTYKKYSMQGKIRMEGEYNHGVKVGTWKMYNEHGDLVRQEEYNDEGEPHGKWETWYGHGRLKSEINYKNGMKEGKVVYYSHRGEKMYEAVFRGDRAVKVNVDKGEKMQFH